MIHAAMPPPGWEGAYCYLRHLKLNIAVQNDGRDLVHVDHAVEHKGDVTVGVSYRKHMVATFSSTTTYSVPSLKEIFTLLMYPSG